MADSFSQGIPSTISTLRELGWGPLWMRTRPGEPPEFRVTISPFRAADRRETALGETTNSGIDPLGMGPETPLEKNLNEGFAVVPEATSLAVSQLFDEIPTGPENGFQLDDGKTNESILPLLSAGRLRYRRLEALHRLLAGERNLAEIHAVDNGPGSIADVSLTLARLGSRVTVKEPGGVSLPRHQRIVGQWTSGEIRNRISYSAPDEINNPTPADIVYWTNPDPYGLRVPKGVSLEDYFGRDVKVGGYLVLQTDHHEGGHNRYRQLELDPQEWETVFHQEIPNLVGAQPNYVLQTAQGVNLHLQIYRRKGVAADPSTRGKAPALSPYSRDDEGRYHLTGPEMNVVVLGDMGGTRTIELARQGHRVVHIDHDSEYLAEAKRRVLGAQEDHRKQNPLSSDWNLAFLHEDWNRVREQANHVEAFYPLDWNDIARGGYKRDLDLRLFLDRAIHSKLKPKGTAFIVSEHWNFIDDLRQTISQNPSLELLEIHQQQNRPPIIGGYAVLTMSAIRHSWLIYRKGN